MVSFKFSATIQAEGWVDGVDDEEAAEEQILDYLRAYGNSANIDIDTQEVDNIEIEPDPDDYFDDDVDYDGDFDADDHVGEDG